jgi:hypothetical protein
LDQRITNLEKTAPETAKLPEGSFYYICNLDESIVANLVYVSGPERGRKMYGGYSQLYSSNGARLLHVGSGILYHAGDYVTYCDPSLEPVIQHDIDNLTFLSRADYPFPQVT